MRVFWLPGTTAQSGSGLRFAGWKLAMSISRRNENVHENDKNINRHSHHHFGAFHLHGRHFHRDDNEHVRPGLIAGRNH